MKLAYLPAVPQKLLLAAIKCYQKTSLFRAPSCRFYPSCSQYMAGCVERHGIVKGSMLAVLRLAKCHPLHPGGVDQVPTELPAVREPLLRTLISPGCVFVRSKRAWLEPSPQAMTVSVDTARSMEM